MNSPYRPFSTPLCGSICNRRPYAIWPLSALKKTDCFHWLAILFVVAIQGLVSSASAAGRILDVTGADPVPISLTDYFAVLEDSTTKLSLDEIRSSAIAGQFKTESAPAEGLSFGFTRSAYWLRLTLQNSSEQPVKRMLEVAYARMSTIQFHQPKLPNSPNPLEPGADYQSRTTGIALPFKTRGYPNRFFVFPVVVPAHSVQVYYLRFESILPILIPARLWVPQAFHEHERNDYITQAWYFGMATAMILFNLLLFFALRDVIYLQYIAFASCTVLAVAAQNGLTKEYIWRDSPLWSEVSTGAAYALSIATMMIFMRTMLATRQVLPKADWVLRATILVLLLLPLGLASSYSQVIKPAAGIYVASLVMILATGLWCAVKRQRSAYFFLAAFSMLCFGAVLIGLRTMGLLSINSITTNGFQFGSALEMILLALALADRFNQIRREKALAQSASLEAQRRLVENLQTGERMLEERVAARTDELSATLERLRQTQDDLVHAEKLASLGSLVAGVSHELNTPIGTALVGSSTLAHNVSAFKATLDSGTLRRSSLTEFATQTVPIAELVCRSCQRASNLIASFKRIAVDQTSEQRRSFDLASLVDDNLAALRPSFRGTPWIIEAHIPAGVACDSYPGPLGQIIASLLQNAVGHAFAERLTGSIALVARLAEGTVELTITDDGNGMDRAMLGRIFEPFYTSRLGQGGSGLGLSIARSLATQVLGGTLSVISEPGAGSSFVLSFPQIAPRQSPPAAYARNAEQENA